MYISICFGENCITIGYGLFVLVIILFSSIAILLVAFSIKIGMPAINSHKLRKEAINFFEGKVNSLTDISVDDKVFNDLLIGFKKEFGYKIGNYVKEISNNTYKIDVEKVSVILDESFKNFYKELKLNNELKKIYLSQLTELFEE